MMGIHKSHVVIMTSLMKSLFSDIQETTCVNKRSLRLSLNALEKRVEKEGLGFFTKTLPKLGQSIDQGLKGFTFSTTAFKLVRGTKLPLFLNGLFKAIFREDGVLTDSPDITAVRLLRQVCFMFYKYDLPYPEALVQSKVNEFLVVNENISLPMTMDANINIHYAQEVLNEIFKTFIHTEPCLRNGPGAVANNEKKWERYRPHRFYEELDELVPYTTSFYYNDKHLFDHFEEFFNLSYEDPCTVLLAVPKDSRGPRLISKEPSEMMAYQQALKNQLYDFLESHPLTKGHVNFTDQAINGALALEGSRNQAWSTLDLKSASDLNSLDLVDALFEGTSIHSWIMKSRSKNIKVNDQTHKLNMYAPMGNALTFPVEALTFFSLIVGNLIANGMGVREACSLVYVYGDDIVVPSKYTELAIESLTQCGLVVNDEKSCFSGYFRESCGTDAFLGHTVTPIRIKKTLNTDCVASLQSWVSYSNDLFWAGYWNLSRKVLSLCSNGRSLPYVTKDSPLIGIETWTLDQAKRLNQGRRKWSGAYQCYTIKGLSIRSKIVKPWYPGWERLNRYAWEGMSIESTDFTTDTFAVRCAANPKHIVCAESWV